MSIVVVANLALRASKLTVDEPPHLHSNSPIPDRPRETAALAVWSFG